MTWLIYQSWVFGVSKWLHTSVYISFSNTYQNYFDSIIIQKENFTLLESFLKDLFAGEVNKRKTTPSSMLFLHALCKSEEEIRCLFRG